MKVVIPLFILLGIVHSRPQVFQVPLEAAKAFITQFQNFQNELGEYSYRFTQSDGQERGETRYIKNPGSKDERVVVEGFYSYNDTNGKEFLVGYKADEGGYQPEGEQLTPSADVKRRPPRVGIKSAAISTLAGGGLG